MAAMCALLVAALICACKTRGDQMTDSRTTTTTLADLAPELGLRFSPATRLLLVDRQSGIDDLLRVKVEMPSSDWPSFLASSPVKPEAFRAGARGMLGSDKGDWDPHAAKQLRTGQAIVHNNRALNLGVDDGRAGAVVVYIVSHGT